MFDIPATYASTSVLLNPDNLKARIGSETLVICGTSKSGTSIAAYALRCAGYDLGNLTGSKTHADPEMSDALQNGGLETVLKRRNAAKSRWGFKLPDAIFHLEKLDETLRNPVFVVTYRNPLAIGRSKVKDAPEFFAPGALGLTAAITDGLERTLEATKACRNIFAPALLVDMDKANSAPDRVVSEILDLLSLKVTKAKRDTIASNIAVPGYKHF